MINKIEALADSLMTVHGYFKPDSESYKLRNPLMLRSWGRAGKHEVTEDGVRIFPSFLGAYRAGIFDIEKKLSGESNSGIQKTDKLKNLLGVYGVNQEKDILIVVSFLKKALGDPYISISTPLSYFAV